MASGADGATDLDSEVPVGGEAGLKIRGAKPDITDSSDEATRQIVAFVLLFLLFIIVIAAFVLLGLINYADSANTSVDDNQADAERLMALMNVVFGPVVTLFSSVVGFYFGARTAKEAADRPPPPSVK